MPGIPFHIGTYLTPLQNQNQVAIVYLLEKSGGSQVGPFPLTSVLSPFRYALSASPRIVPANGVQAVTCSDIISYNACPPEMKIPYIISTEMEIRL